MARSVLSGLAEFSEEYAAFIFTHPKEGGSNFLRNAAKCMLDYTLSQLERPYCGYSLLSKGQISCTRLHIVQIFSLTSKIFVLVTKINKWTSFHALLLLINLLLSCLMVLLIKLIYMVKNYKTANDELERTRKEACLSCFRIAFQCFLRVGKRNHEN